MSRSTQATQQYSYNDASIRLRIVDLIRALLPNAHPDNVTFLATHICSTLTRMQKNNQLGPKGIQSTEDVFVGIGYQGKECYMGLLVNAPGAGGVKCFFEGDRMETMEKLGMRYDAAVEELQRRLVSKVGRVYDQIRDEKLAQRR